MNTLLHVLLPILLVAASACATTQSQSGDNGDTDTAQLLALALRKAVVEEKDIPDYQLLRDKKRIVLSNTIGPALRDTTTRRLDPSDVPTFKGVSFILDTPFEIQARANKEGDFVYLHIDAIDIGLICLNSII